VSELKHRFVETNGIRMHVVEQGEGPLVLLCHGWPESWYSWRHQIRDLAAAGYRVVAPDQRGYGQTDKPEAVDQYTILHLVGDMVGLLDALGAPTAVIAGHDWGAPVAWNCALMRPDRFPAVIGMSVPYSPRAPMRPIQGLQMMAGENFFYILYFQQPGVAEAELETDVRATLRRVYYSASGSPPRDEGWRPALPKTAKFLDGTMDPESLPGWFTEADLDFYTGEFQRSGFRGGLNWYRNLDRTWELTAPWAGAKVTVPALFITGERDVVRTFMGPAIDNIKQSVPNLKETVVIPGSGHWNQQEYPSETTKPMLDFLKSL
jgi:pimeloyl-ACP methyl ester carboxylesterase